ncbi:MAG: IS1380 family transposase, partial [Rhodobacteraceae bacterium]|nr:IS1380 family transposase [Paracoccaceae bacterium]
VLRTHCETRYAAASWGGVKRRVVARIEAKSTFGMDVRYVLTSLTGSTPEHLYEKDYCARGQAENLPFVVVLRKRLPGDGLSSTRPS